MLLWTCAVACAFASFPLLTPRSSLNGFFGGSRAERENLKRVASLFQELQETLEAGTLPRDERWRALEGLPAPWGRLAAESMRTLRAQGAAVLPTLRRLHHFAESHSVALQDGRARSSQALGQVWICATLVPVFGVALYALLPGVSDSPLAWSIACSMALMLASQGALWLMRMSERARWAGLETERRSWQLLAPCSIERFLALLKAGIPPDQAWSSTLQVLAIEAPELASAWGHDVWREREGPIPRHGRSACANTLADAGDSLRKAIQTSLMEGRPCSERIETALSALRSEIRSQVDFELQCLPNRALKPLFLCIAPALFGLLGFGLFLAWESASSGSLG